MVRMADRRIVESRGANTSVPIGSVGNNHNRMKAVRDRAQRKD